MIRLCRRLLPVAIVVGISAAAGVAAAPATATPAWLLNGSPLVGSEEASGVAEEATIVFAGLSTTCETTELQLTIANTAGTGKGTIDDAAFQGCATDTACSVEAVEPESLPWPVRLATVEGADYLIAEQLHFTIVFGGVECVLYETPLEITGSIGGIYYDTSEQEGAKLAPLTFKATKTALKAFGVEVDWLAFFRIEAVGSGLPLTVG